MTGIDTVENTLMRPFKVCGLIFCFLFCMLMTFGDWYQQKTGRNTFYLKTMNPVTSKITSEDWRLTPNSTNLVETEHAHLNAITDIRLPLLSSILTYSVQLYILTPLIPKF